MLGCFYHILISELNILSLFFNLEGESQQIVRNAEAEAAASPHFV